MSYDSPNAEPPDPYDRYYEPRRRHAYPAHEERSRESARHLPDPGAGSHRGSRNQDHRPAPASYSVPEQRTKAWPRPGPDHALRTAAPSGRERGEHAQSSRRGARMTAGENFWYVLGCVAMGGMYLAKVPCKKALEEAGLARMTSAERIWYLLGCIPFGAFYFCKIPVKKALAEAAGQPSG